MSRPITVFAGAILVTAAVSIAAQSPAPLAALARMPIKEVTIFKDGHAFVLHEGSLPTDGAGHVLMDYLPTPVLGTFWPYTTAKDAKLTGVVAGQRRVLVEETALTIPELIAANAGAEAIITERGGGAAGPARYAGTIVGIPERSSAELAATGLPNAAPRTPERGAVVMIRTAEGIKVVAIEAIQDITFKAPPRPKVAHEEFRNLLTLQLDWAGRTPAANVPVGLVYVQRGLRWIPNYRVAIDGKGGAALRLQATLINELAGFEDATANLVIGVPSFAFQDSLDPIALQQTAAQLSPQLQPGTRMSSLSNSIMSQASFRSDASGQPAAPSALGPDVPEGASSEDLFVFTVRRLSMKKGERVVAPVADYTLPYKDVFTLDIPFAPPPEVRGSLNNDQEEEMARALGAPQVAHKIRLTNQGKHPLTTAPALILRDDRVLAQGLMTYTAIGGSGDLEITKAPDIQARKTDSETGRIPNGRTLDGSSYARIDLTGRITLTNYRDRPVEIEVTRQVLGNVTTADHGGVVTGENVFENAGLNAMPRWWRWYNWPSWWSHFNGMGRITWKLTLEPRKPVDLGYSWHYFWR